MVYSIEEIKSIVMPIVEKYSIPAIFLFGSYARGEANENSDIDFLVDTTGAGLNSLTSLGALYCDLEDTFKKRIDLITASSIMQEPKMPSDVDFKDTVMRERAQLNDVAHFAEKHFNAETEAAMLEAERITGDKSVKAYKNMDELFAALKE